MSATARRSVSPTGATLLRSAATRRVLRILLGAATLAAILQAALSFVLAPIQGRFSGQFEDFGAYWDAATLSAAGHSPYATFDSSTMTMSGFIYPPFGAVLVRPLAFLDHHAASIVFLWLGLACLVAGGVIAARTLLPASWPRTQIGIVGVLAFPPATFNLWHGQANPLIFLLLVLALQSWVRGNEIRCGMLLGLAAAIKLAPLIFLILLLRRRWWRGAGALALAAATASLIGLVVMGTSATRTWLSLVLPSLSRDNGWVFNQTIGAMLSRLVEHSVLVWDADVPLLHAGAVAGGLACIVIAALAVRPGERDAQSRGLEFGAGVAAMVLSGSIAWYAHDLHLLLPLLALLGYAARRPMADARSAFVVLAGGVIVLAVLMPQLIADTAVQEFITRTAGGVGWWLYLQLWSLPVVVTALLLGACATLSRRTVAPPASSSPA